MVKVHFHWRFWDPVECVGGKVYLGTYYEVTVEGKTTLQTPEQFRVKLDMGIIRKRGPKG